MIFQDNSPSNVNDEIKKDRRIVISHFFSTFHVRIFYIFISHRLSLSRDCITPNVPGIDLVPRSVTNSIFSVRRAPATRTIREAIIHKRWKRGEEQQVKQLLVSLSSETQFHYNVAAVLTTPRSERAVCGLINRP